MIKFSTVLVSFPFDDFSGQKVRPALCLIEPIGEFEHVIVAFISSKIPNNLEESDFLLGMKGHGFKNTGLFKDSVLRLHKVVTVPKSAIKRKLGEFDKELQIEVKKRIRKLYIE